MKINVNSASNFQNYIIIYTFQLLRITEKIIMSFWDYRRCFCRSDCLNDRLQVMSSFHFSSEFTCNVCMCQGYWTEIEFLTSKLCKKHIIKLFLNISCLSVVAIAIQKVQNEKFKHVKKKRFRHTDVLVWFRGIVIGHCGLVGWNLI